jgi:tetratricopeptide (TPR) repeat protein
LGQGRGPNPIAKKPSDQAGAGQLTTVGDRLFRAGNLRRARERYEQAARAAPDLALPRLRLAQVALARGNYSEAASCLREAETAQPGWIITAPDIQAIYGEPGEFARTTARLESHLQIHPDDRDAWLVLGAAWFLTGRTAKAADIFRRLNDPKRKPDVALAAFLDASNQADARFPKPLAVDQRPLR